MLPLQLEINCVLVTSISLNQFMCGFRYRSLPFPNHGFPELMFLIMHVIFGQELFDYYFRYFSNPRLISSHSKVLKLSNPKPYVVKGNRLFIKYKR